MKDKIIVITAMLAVMIAMTGNAAATYVNIDSSTIYGQPDIIINPLDGSTVSTTDVVIGSLPNGASLRDLQVITSDANLYARVYDNSIPFDNGYGNIIPAIASWNYGGSPNYHRFYLDVKGTTAGTVTVYDMKNGVAIGEAGVNSGSADINVPEFPTVALPIAAVIGLVFFFQQKKMKGDR